MQTLSAQGASSSARTVAEFDLALSAQAGDAGQISLGAVLAGRRAVVLVVDMAVPGARPWLLKELDQLKPEWLPDLVLVLTAPRGLTHEAELDLSKYPGLKAYRDGQGLWARRPGRPVLPAALAFAPDGTLRASLVGAGPRQPSLATFIQNHRRLVAAP